jgi:hypothetical protein
MKLEFSRQDFEKYSNIKFNENPSSGNGVVRGGRVDGWTDTHDEANGLFRNFLNGPNKELVVLAVAFCTYMLQVACLNLCGGTGHTGVLFRGFLSQFRQLPGQYHSTRLHSKSGSSQPT